MNSFVRALAMVGGVVFGGCVAGEEVATTTSVDVVANHLPLARREELVAALRTKSYLDRIGPGPVTKPLVGELVILLMVDSDVASRSANGNDLIALGLTPEDALAVGLANVSRIAGRVKDRLRKTGDGSLGIMGDGNYYGSSLLLDVDGWTHAASLVRGELVAAVPTRDALLYKWIEQPVDLAVFGQIAGHLHDESPLRLSRDLLRWTGNGWEAMPNPAPSERTGASAD